jgi:diacylglycerol kinase family enzyme
VSTSTTRESDQLTGEAGAPFSFASPETRRRMLIIVNPYATTVSDRLRHLVVYALQGRYEVDAVDTEARGHATELCREAAHEGYDVVVAFGGDGTVNEAANGLIGSPAGRAGFSSTPLCCLPGGSANVFAKMLGIPGDVVDATEHLLAMADDWRPRKVDVGVVNGRCFTFASGLGLDASVVEQVDANPRMKARFGPYFFAWVAVGTFLRRYLVSPPRLEVETMDTVDEGPRVQKRKVKGITAVVQNGSPFTYFKDRPIDIADGAALDSGSLAGGVLRRATPLAMPAIALRALSAHGRVSGHRQVAAIEPTRELVVRSADSRPLPLEVDGDYLGEVNEARYSILAQALSVIA